MKLNRAVFRYVEFELYNYDETKEAIEQEREVILHGSAVQDEKAVIQNSRISDTTGSKGIKLATNTALLRMEKTIKAIDRALQLLGEEHNILFTMKYKERQDWRQVCQEIPVSERTYFRLRKELVEMVALQTGHALIE